MSTAEPPRPPTFTAISPSGTIAVRITEQGRPIRITVTQDDLYRAPHDLAAEILRLCRCAANRAGLARRAQLEEAGLTAQELALTGLPTPDEVAREEQAYEEEYGTGPRIWTRSI